MPYTLYNSYRYWIICRTLASYFLTRITAHQNQIEVWNVTEPSWLYRHFLHCLFTISHFHLSSCVTKIEVILLAIIITIDNVLVKILLRFTEQVSEAIFLLSPETVFLFRGWSTAHHKKGETLNRYKVSWVSPSSVLHGFLSGIHVGVQQSLLSLCPGDPHSYSLLCIHGVSWTKT